MRTAARAARGRMILAFLGLSGLVLSACNGAPEANNTDDAFPRREVIVAVGQSPPSPEDMGVADHIQPGRMGPPMGFGLAEFGDNWNEAATDLERPDLIVPEFLVGYSQTRANFQHAFIDWLVVHGTIDYETGDLFSATVDWDTAPDIGGVAVINSLATLTIATNPALGSDGALDVVRRLGIADATMRDFDEGFDITMVHDGLEYTFRTDANGGRLRVSATND